jgi:type IV pilus assembly protein PilX
MRASRLPADMPAALFSTRQAGFALITSLLILVVVTLLAISMFQGTGLQQKIAGNSREKERAFEAAQSSLQYGEYWLTNGDPGTGLPCTASVNVTSDADMRACMTTLPNPGDPATWPTTLGYTPPAMKVNDGSNGIGGQTPDSTDILYAQVPGLHIAYMGTSGTGNKMLYMVTAAGYGGSSATVSVVQSVYATTTSVKDLGGPGGGS